MVKTSGCLSKKCCKFHDGTKCHFTSEKPGTTQKEYFETKRNAANKTDQDSRNSEISKNDAKKYIRYRLIVMILQWCKK